MFDFLFTNPNFNSAIKVVLHHEGLLSNDANDPGGITKYGISLRFLRAAGIDGNGYRSGHVGPEDVRALDVNQATAIYRKYFWNKNNFNQIQSTLISTSLFDMSVLMGAYDAIELIQNALSDQTVNKVTVDGIMGAKTINAINQVNSSRLNERFKMLCIEHFEFLIKKNKLLAPFLDGWKNRVNSL